MFKPVYINILNDTVYASSIHTHPYWEIVYYTMGQGVVTVDDKSFQFENNIVICLPPDVPHYEQSEQGYKNIHFHVSDFDYDNSNILCFKDSDSLAFYHILVQILKEFHKKQNYSSEIVTCLSNALYWYIIAWNSTENRNVFTERLENALVSNISNKNFNILDAINDIPMSRDHLCKLFRKETGITPLQYLIGKRIEYAKHLLKTKYAHNSGMKEIASLSGFDDPLYFSRSFKKHTGMSPKEWQSKHK